MLISFLYLFGSAGDVSRMIKEEQCEVIVDLRAEAEENNLSDSVERINIPLIDKQEGQEELIRTAAAEVVRHYQEGELICSSFLHVEI